MIRVEPQQINFLKAKPSRVQFKLPPVENFVELLNINYPICNVAYETIYYSLECYVVAIGEAMYHDFIKGTDVQKKYIVKATKGFYFMLSPGELDKFLVKVDSSPAAIAC